jgi:hypothetical protein
VLIPLVNVPFDWISIGLTRFLLRKNLKNSKKRRWFYSIADLAGAIVSLILLSMAMIFIFEFVDAIGRAKGMVEPVIGVKTTLNDINTDGWAGRHAWLYFALFSTLIPIICHVFIYVLSRLSATSIVPGKDWVSSKLTYNLEGGALIGQALEQYQFDGPTRMRLAAWFTVRMSFGIIATLGAIALLIYGASKLPFIGGAYLSFIIWFHEIVVQLFS